jgi:hypothetical protein
MDIVALLRPESHLGGLVHRALDTGLLEDDRRLWTAMHDLVPHLFLRYGPEGIPLMDVIAYEVHACMGLRERRN